MQSQTTLVDFITTPTELKPSWITLRFDIDSINNTSLSISEMSKKSYIVASNKYASTTTVYRMLEDGSEAIVGRIERSEFLPARITLTCKQPIRTRRWLKTPMFAPLPATFEVNGGSFIWKTYDSTRVALYACNDQQEPLAWLNRGSTASMDGQFVRTFASISLNESVDGIRDAIILSCIVIEYNLRTKEKARSVSTASVGLQFATGPVFSIF